MAGLSERKPVILVTGMAGFTGHPLRLALEAAGWQVFGVDRQASRAAGNMIAACDLLDQAATASMVGEINPDAVIHLAGISSVTHDDIGELYTVNIVGTRNLLEALLASRHRIRSVILASSATVYGNTGGSPLDESVPPAPVNDYAVSKLAMEYLARMYVGKLPITFVRPFNYTGRGQTTRFVIPKIIEHVKRKAPYIELGNMDVIREFSDVRRVVAAYVRLLSIAGKGEVYNICSGIGIRLRDIMTTAESLSGHHLEVRSNPAYLRGNEVEVLIGSCERLERAVGTLPVFSIEETLAWMLED